MDKPAGYLHARPAKSQPMTTFGYIGIGTMGSAMVHWTPPQVHPHPNPESHDRNDKPNQPPIPHALVPTNRTGPRPFTIEHCADRRIPHEQLVTQQ